MPASFVARGILCGVIFSESSDTSTDCLRLSLARLLAVEGGEGGGGDDSIWDVRPYVGLLEWPCRAMAGVDRSSSRAHACADCTSQV